MATDPWAPVIVPATIENLVKLGSFGATATVLKEKYNESMAFADWAKELLTVNTDDIRNRLGTDTVLSDISAIKTAVDAIQLYTPGNAVTYTAPDSPTYLTIPEYTPQTLGTMLAIPAVEAITIGDVPSTVVSFTNTEFTDTLLTGLKSKLLADFSTASTGLGNAEAALFSRDTARQSAARATAYAEITTQFSSRNFDVPPGAILGKQTEANNESNIRLSDASSQIMAESARLAQAWNQSALTASVQCIGLIAQTFDSKILRDFEAAKTGVQLAIEGFKSEVSVAIAKAELNKAAITATVEANAGTVQTFQAEIAGEIEPIKAIAGANQTIAAAYGTAVQSAFAELSSQIAPEELKLKGVGVNAQIGSTKAELIAKEVSITIDAAVRQLTLEVSTLAGLAQASSQMIASSLNSVNVSASMGYSGNYSENDNLNIARGDVSKTQSITE